jgi:hypothetical protein
MAVTIINFSWNINGDQIQGRPAKLALATTGNDAALDTAHGTEERPSDRASIMIAHSVSCAEGGRTGLCSERHQAALLLRHPQTAR